MKKHLTGLRWAFAIVLALCVGLLLTGFSPCRADDTAIDDQKWTPIFDGKTLDGWTVSKIDADKKAEVKDGIIIIGREGLASGIKYDEKFYDKPFPKSNFEIMYQAKRADGYDFFGTMTFPVKESHCSFLTGGWSGSVIGLSSINGYDASENETTAFYPFKDKQWYQFRLCVSDDRITVWLYPVDEAGKTIEPPKDDQKALDAARLEIEKPKVDLVLDSDKRFTTRLEVSFFQPLGISTWNTEGHLRDIKYRELTPEEVAEIKDLPERSRTQ